MTLYIYFALIVLNSIVAVIFLSKSQHMSINKQRVGNLLTAFSVSSLIILGLIPSLYTLFAIVSIPAGPMLLWGVIKPQFVSGKKRVYIKIIAWISCLSWLSVVWWINGGCEFMGKCVSEG